MSTDYRPIPAILFAQLFDGCLEKYGVREGTKSDSTTGRCLVGSDGALEVCENDDGTSRFSRRTFASAPSAVIAALQDEFDAELVSEADHRFWGFASKEEEAQQHKEMAKESEDAFYQDLLCYLRGEPNGLKHGTIGMKEAEIAAALVATDEKLIAPENRQQLLEAVRTIYDRDYTVKFKVSSNDPVAIELAVALWLAKTDTLPQA